MNLAETFLMAASSFLLMSCAYATEGLSLPDPLTTIAGSAVRTPEEWRGVRRGEILELFRSNVYGRAPVARPDDLRFEAVEIEPRAMSGLATRKQVDIHFSGPGGEGAIRLVLFVPNHAPKPAPGFLLICNRPREEHIDPTREKRSEFWPAEEIVARGYAAAAFHYSDIAPDDSSRYQEGAIGIFSDAEGERAPDAWGAIAAWAWGAGRAMDYFETDPDVDESRVAVVGHSRGGKTALWCGAEDERFALVISNNSGCTGAALARHRQGETVEQINRRFPHWFCSNYQKYNDREDELPVDQHELIALMAPRLVYVASASEDSWADPEGEFLSCVYAEPVYRLFGLPGLGTEEMPEVGQPLHEGYIGYHLRAGKHNLTQYDWMRFMDFADRHWREDSGAGDQPGASGEADKARR